ncbi:MAG: DNA double-strand break repair nuclease NurA [Cyanobacteria bacterium J06642_2]
MLDTFKLAAQMPAIGEYLQREAQANRDRLDTIVRHYQRATANPKRWQERQPEDCQQLGFNVATPIEPLALRSTATALLTPHTLIATDGSQITPNHHEVAYCSLINIGRVAIHYGVSRQPLLDSVPQVFYRADEFDRDRPPGVGIETILGLRRTQAEAEELARLAVEMQQAGYVAIALTDGALIHWGVESFPKPWQKRWLEPMLESFEHLRAARIPLAGYVSASRSSEVVNFLRLGLCPFENCNCREFCAEKRIAAAPCSPLLKSDKRKPTSRKSGARLGGVGDRLLWSMLLQPGQRSPIWRSQLAQMQLYGEHCIHFCYLHVGSEIARIEMPKWVATDSNLLDLALGAVLAQVQRGMGYPIALAEAHHLAVVKGGDRQRFFALIDRQLQEVGLQTYAISQKEANKRRGIA